ncbi:glycosyltransferase family 4 protein [Flavobacterium sp.]|jgi:glycosyltransferase involved in cell wall biosynthesis|uniref:glycosyltransferase family 4 protein n=1 Tax=Flavobacterium sp. TaxID=239 RepID=UPI0037BF9C2F
MSKTLIRITTIPISLEKLLSGQLRFMNSYFNVIGISSDKVNLQKVQQKEGIEVYPIEMTRKITPFRDIKSVIQLYFYFKKTRPFIVHTHTPKAGIVGMLAAKLAKVPNRLHTVAGLPLLEATGIKRRVLDFVEKLTYDSATMVYPNSRGLNDIIIQNKYCENYKLKVLVNGSSNGIDTSHFDLNLFSKEKNVLLKKELGINDDDFVFIFVGRLVRDKGINELIRAFQRFQSENSLIKLLLIGNYESDLDPLEIKTLQTISSNKGIISTGFQYDVRPYFAISNCLVFPSYREGFPNVVMQAGSMGLPCVVSDINGCNEIVIDCINGFIIPVKDENAIFTAMKKIVESSELFQKMKQVSREMIVSRYEQKIVWDALLKEYQSL